MKILDKITLILFSMIILILAVIMSLLVFGWVTPTVVLSVYGKIVASNVVSNTILGVSGVCIVLALKAIFFGGNWNTDNGINGEGILLENESGKLLISKETIENLVNGVAKGFENTQSVTTKVIIDSQNTLRVFVTLMVLPNTVINELSMNLQSRIKEVVKSVTDLEIKSIDIKIKNITTSEENKEV
ncbi:MAG: alkaline shock response membrane anchor protein AmaP [Clostridia bacterium]|nr:alkaline shock response membrane anchor protein AmaP [Clostridia bacterium]